MPHNRQCIKGRFFLLFRELLLVQNLPANLILRKWVYNYQNLELEVSIKLHMQVIQVIHLNPFLL